MVQVRGPLALDTLMCRRSDQLPLATLANAVSLVTGKDRFFRTGLRFGSTFLPYFNYVVQNLLTA